MAITRKPTPRSSESDAVDVEALINKGGSVAGQGRRPASKSAPVVVRIPPALLERIDTAVEARPVPTPRHTWLLEAIVEKLERDSD